MKYKISNYHINIFLFLFIASSLMLIMIKFKIAFFLLAGFFSEELLHFILLCIFNKSIKATISIKTIYIVPIMFSVLVPNNISKNKKIAIVILAPLIVIMVGFVLLLNNCYFKFALLYMSFSVSSLIPIKIINTQTDMFTVLELLKKND